MMLEDKIKLFAKEYHKVATIKWIASNLLPLFQDSDTTLTFYLISIIKHCESRERTLNAELNLLRLDYGIRGEDLNWDEKRGKLE